MGAAVTNENSKYGEIGVLEERGDGACYRLAFPYIAHYVGFRADR